MKKYKVEYTYASPYNDPLQAWILEVEGANKRDARAVAWMQLAENHPAAIEITIQSIELI